MSSSTTAPKTRREAAGRPPKGSGGSAIMSHREILLVIYALMTGMFLSSLDQTIVGTAIRTIGDDLHGLEQQAWVTTGYLITSTISTPIYGKLSDIFGRRPLYIFGIAVFVIGSLASSFSTSMLMLAAFRALQGIGGGALMSLPLAIMGDILAPRERAKYQGYFLAVFGISSVVGPLIGGIFAGANEILWVTGWRWVFLINVPIGIIALGMVITFLHLPKRAKHENPRIDWWGALFVIMTLTPLLLVAEQGREWGWGSGESITCYIIAGVGLIAFLITEQRMKSDAIIPLKLFRSYTFSMASVIGFLVGFAMFGAMLTIPLYMQIVIGLDPTESGFAMLPMVLGMMIASIGSGLIVSKTGKYRIFPVTGTFITGCGYVCLTFIKYNSPLWQLMIAMFLVGLGLGQLMQTLTLATQNSVKARDMGVATSASTFFRQIGGTMGTAVLLSVLFSVMGGNIASAMGNKADLTAGLNAAMNPSVASAPHNRGVMKQIWTPIVNPVKKNIQSGLDKGTEQAKAAADKAVTAKVTEAVQAQVAAGRVPQQAAESVIAQQVASVKPQAEEQALTAASEKAHASVDNGRLVVDWSDKSQREYWVDQVAPKLSDKFHDAAKKSKSSTSSDATNDTSFLKGADSVLSKPFMKGFTASAVAIYRVGLAVIALAFILTWFFKVPPLRQTSAMQEAHNERTAADAAAESGNPTLDAANTAGVPVLPEKAADGAADGVHGSTEARSETKAD